MCFSAQASLIASGTLSAFGIGSIKQLKRTLKKGTLALALMPFLFAFQQFTEGMVWLTLGTQIQIYLSYLFLFFSHFFWPSYVPIAFYLQESNLVNKKILKTFIPIGIITGLYIATFVILNGFELTINQNHLTYSFDIPFVEISMATYLIATVLPSAFSSSKLLKLFSFTLAISYLVSFFAFTEALISVWCFFAAVLSLLIIIHLRLNQSNQ